jgi:cobalamin-dependent methionine synthase I
MRPDEREGGGEEVAQATGLVMMATLPGDRAAAGEFWRVSLTDAGHSVESLGVRAAPIVASRVAGLAPKALVLHVHSRQVRTAIQALIAQLQRRGTQVPVLLGGAGVDAEFAQWVAIPQGGTPYWGGIYYCEDAHEMLEVLRQIVLFTPPPPAHAHDAPGVEPQGCSICGDCPLADSCDTQV